jgi:predicted Rossmann fold nucleotide-binding protein DprA/Smf involved in DNA uptake
MKQLQKGLQSAVKALTALATKIDEISKKLGETEKAVPAIKSPPKAAKKKPAVKPVKKSVPKKTARAKTVKKDVPKKAVTATGSDQVLKIVSASEKGVNTADLISKTGFKAKKVQNIVFRLRKQGKIKNASKGVYVKA